MTMKHDHAEEPTAAPVPAADIPPAAPAAAELPAEPAAAAPAAAENLTTESGDFAPEWYKRFAELKPYGATLAKFRRPEALAKSYAHLEKLKGYPEAGDERRMSAFRTAVGLPATAAEYSLPRPEETPDELWNPALVQSLGEVAYEYGVPPRAMEALCQRYAEEGRRFLAESHAAAEAAAEAADAALQQEWGAHYEENMDTVASFLHTMGERSGVDVAKLTDNPALRADPDFARLMLAAADLMQEAPLREGEHGDDRREAHRIAHDPSHPLHEAYMRTSHPQHRYANEQYDRLAFGRRL